MEGRKLTIGYPGRGPGDSTTTTRRSVRRKRPGAVQFVLYFFFDEQPDIEANPWGEPRRDALLDDVGDFYGKGLDFLAFISIAFSRGLITY